MSHNRRRLPRLSMLPAALLGLGACGDSARAPAEREVPAVYAFESRFVPGASSVDYGGQTFRHVLLLELKAFIAGLSARIDAGTLAPTQSGELVGALDSFFTFDAETRGAEPLTLTTDPPLLQEAWEDLGGGRTLVGKVAGNDAVTDFKDFTGGDFRGWSDPAITAAGGDLESPEGLIRAFFATLEAQAIARVNAGPATDAAGQPLPVHVTPSGLDLNELIQKFTTCAVAFHQGADDYLDDDLDGKGLRASNLAPASATVAWTELEHAWDEGFGYFGAARDFLAYTDEELSGAGGREGWSEGWHDSDGDGRIDLGTEYNFGHAVNAAKRDRGARPGGETDLTGRAMAAFLEGRALIHAAAGRALTAAEHAELKGLRDEAVRAWEEAIAASALHYVNATLQALEAAGSDAFSHAALARAWSELKGFALCSQFNPDSPLSAEAFVRLHALIGDAPVLPAAGEAAVTAWRAALREARGLIATTWGLPAANLGDDAGAGGW